MGGAEIDDYNILIVDQSTLVATLGTSTMGEEWEVERSREHVRLFSPLTDDVEVDEDD